MKKYLPLAVIGAICICSVIFSFGSKNLTQLLDIFKPLLIIIIITGIASLYLWRVSKRKLPPKQMAEDFARLIKKMMDLKFSLGIFIFKDGWWRLLCLENENDENGELIGQWTQEEADSMIENGIKMMFKNGHIDKRCLVKGVLDISVESVVIDENTPPTVAINIVYEN